MLKLIWKQLRVIKKNFRINDVLLVWNSEASATGWKIFVAALNNLYPPHAARQWHTQYCFSNHHVHVISEESFRDSLRQLQGWISILRKQGSGVMERCAEDKGSWWGGVLHAFQNNVGHLVINFPSISRNTKNTGPAFWKLTGWKKRDGLFFHRRGDTQFDIQSGQHENEPFESRWNQTDASAFTFLLPEGEKKKRWNEPEATTKLHFWVSIIVFGEENAGKLFL